MALLMGGLGLGSAGVTAGAAGATSSFAITALAGPNRFATAAAIAAKTFPQGTATVIVASGLAANVSDSLAASYLAAQENGGAGAPILLVSSTGVPPETVAAIAGLRATHVVIVGGSGAVSADVASALSNGGALGVTRVAGADRFATADAVDSQSPMTRVGSVNAKSYAIVADGVDASLVDALGASPIAYAGPFPLLLVNGPSATLSSTDLGLVASARITNVVLVGGSAAIGPQVASQLGAAGISSVRVAGPDRSATSAALADFAIATFGFSDTHFNVASGEANHLVDSLSGGPHGGSEKAPTLITSSIDNAGPVVGFAAAHTTTETGAHLFGGPASVDATAAAAIVAAATDTLPPGPSLAGSATLGTYTLGLKDSAGEPLPTEVIYPVEAQGSPVAGRHPLIVFAEGYRALPGYYSQLLDTWAKAGFVVAAPIFPNTNANSVTLNENDLFNQPAEMTHVIVSLLSFDDQPGNPLYQLIDPAAIGVAGHSDGGATVAALSYNTCCVNPRVSATAILSGSELSGFPGSYFTSPGPSPLLVVQGLADNINSPSNSTDLYAADAAGARYYLMLTHGTHWTPYSTDLTVLQQPGYTAAQLEAMAAAELPVVERVSTDFFEAELVPGAGVTAAQVLHDGSVTGTATIESAKVTTGG